MEENNDQKPIIQTTGQESQKLTAADRKELKQLLLLNVEAKTEADRFSDSHFDRERVKHKLLSGAEISIAEVKSVVENIARPYAPMFKIRFWREVFKIFGWDDDPAIYLKRREAAIFIREVIYGRFDKGVLLSFHILNPYTGFIKRNYKHFQFMTDEGIEKLAEIIEQAIELMKTCNTYYEFRKEWYNKYGVPYQLDAMKEAGL